VIAWQSFSNASQDHVYRRQQRKIDASFVSIDVTIALDMHVWSVLCAEKIARKKLH